MDATTHKSGRRLVRAAVIGAGRPRSRRGPTRSCSTTARRGVRRRLQASAVHRPLDVPAPGHSAGDGRTGLRHRRVRHPRVVRVAAARLKRYAVCYIDAGTWENWRPDRQRFPDSVLGRANGWPGERWLDIRRIDVLVADHARPHLTVPQEEVRRGGARQRRRLHERDRVPADGRRPAPLQPEARAPRAPGRPGGGPEERPRADPRAAQDFDFAVVEQCFQYDECDKMRPFIRPEAGVRGRVRAAGVRRSATAPASCASTRCAQSSICRGPVPPAGDRGA